MAFLKNVSLPAFLKVLKLFVHMQTVYKTTIIKLSVIEESSLTSFSGALLWNFHVLSLKGRYRDPSWK